MRQFIRDNALSLATLGLCVFILVGQSLVGLAEYNEQGQEHGQPAVGHLEYLGRGHFAEAVFENWESEFLQMAALVLLTAALLQKGSPESKKPGGEKVDKEPRRRDRDAPWPVRRGGWALKLYENSLFLALFGLFVLSFAIPCARTDYGIGALLASPTYGGMLARWLWPAAIGVPLLIGTIAWTAYSGRVLSDRSAILAMMVAMITLLAGFTVISAHRIDRSDSERRRSNDALREKLTRGLPDGIALELDGRSLPPLGRSGTVSSAAGTAPARRAMPVA